MPWTSRDAYRHTRKAHTPDAQERWASVANSVLKETGDEARAIRAANAALESYQSKPPPKAGAPKRNPKP